MFAAIGAADHINLETYKIEDDEIGRQFSELLLQKRAQGVQVNLLYDSVGSIGTPQAFFDRLTAGGVQVLEFNPVNPLSAKKVARQQPRPPQAAGDRRPHRIRRRNQFQPRAFGRIVRRAPGAGGESAWRDTHLRIEGPVVDEFQKLFMQTWAKQRGAPLAAASYFPRSPARAAKWCARSAARPTTHSLIYLTLISAISKAESHVYLTNAYCFPDPQLLDALTDAARRGVDVRLVLPGKSDSGPVFMPGARTIPPCCAPV